MSELLALVLLGANPDPVANASDPLVLSVIGYHEQPDHELREVILDKMIVCADVLVTAEKVVDEHVDAPALLVTLNDLGKGELARITGGNAGRMLRLSISGNEIMRPVIQEPITQGQIQIFGPGIDLDQLIFAMQQQCPDARADTE